MHSTGVLSSWQRDSRTYAEYLMTCCFVVSPKPQCEGSNCLCWVMIIFGALWSIWYVLYSTSKLVELWKIKQNKTSLRIVVLWFWGRMQCFYWCIKQFLQIECIFMRDKHKTSYSSYLCFLMCPFPKLTLPLSERMGLFLSYHWIHWFTPHLVIKRIQELLRYF